MLPESSQQNFLLNPAGDSILTGAWIPAKGKLISQSEMAPPLHSALNKSPKKVLVQQNVNKKSFPVSSILPSDLASVEIGKNGIPIPQSHPIIGKRVSLHPTPPLVAQAPRMKDLAISDLRCLEVDQGLISPLITCMMQDTEGYLWIGSDEGGICRYDGNNFQYFTTEQGLSSNTVNAILQDKAGVIWIATAIGLNRFDGNRFTHFTPDEGLMGNWISSLFLDSRGHLWMGSNGGLGRFVPESEPGPDGYLTVYTLEQGLADLSTGKIAEDPNGNIWFGTYDQGAHRFSPNKEDMGGKLLHLSTKVGLSGDKVRSIAVDRNQQVWIGTFSHGLNVYREATATQPSLLLKYNQDNGLSHKSVISFLQDSQGNKWVGTGGGINKVEMQENGSATITFYQTDHGLSHNNIYSIFEDTEGNIWIGTHKGVCLLDPEGGNSEGGSHFTHYGKRNGLLSNKVVSILEDQRGDIWFGTMGGLHRYDGESISQFNIEDGLSSRSVRTMMEDSKGHLWFGTERGGLNRFIPSGDGKTGKILQYDLDQGLSDYHITAMLEDSRGNYWFATLAKGVNRFIPDSSGLAGSFLHYGSSDGLSDDRVRYMLEDKQGNIWFGSKGGGASCFAPDQQGQGGKFKHFTTFEGLSHNKINCILEDSQGNVWFGSWGGGITRYSPETETFSYFTVKDGLSGNTIWTLIEDPAQRIWAATDHGLSLLVPASQVPPQLRETNPRDYYLYTFGKEDGLKNIVFEGNSVCLDKENRIWWGGGFNGGLTMLDLKDFELPQQTPKVMLSHINIADRFIDFRHLEGEDSERVPFIETLKRVVDSVPPFVNYPQNLVLPYKLNHLSFHFSALDWKSPHKLEYSYQMEGLEDSWSIPGSDNQAEYRNLPYGDFSFNIKARGGSQIWSEVSRYPLSIQPPWWHSWWARGLYALLFAFLIYAFIQWRLSALTKERNDKKAFAEALIFAQEEEKKRIARDLHDGIGQSLLLIKKQMEKTTATTHNNQELIAHTLEEVRAISQDLHPFQLEKFGLTVSITEIIKKIEHSTDLFITYEIDNIDNLLSPKAEINLYRTIQEALSNIVKHAEASAAKIHVKLEAKLIRVHIQDNGKGFDHSGAFATSKSLGLKTMYERISSIDGDLTILKGEPKGSQVHIQVPVDRPS